MTVHAQARRAWLAGGASVLWFTVVGCAIGFGFGGVTGMLVIGGVSLLFGAAYGIACAIGRVYELTTAGGAGVYVVDHTWSLPNTVVGTLWLVGNLLFGNRIDKAFTAGRGHLGLVDGAISIGTTQYATTIGPVQAGTKLNIDQHEAVHVLQARVFGPLYLPLVIGNYVLATLVPYWLVYHDHQNKPINGVGRYFVCGVYAHVWHEEWAYKVQGSPPC